MLGVSPFGCGQCLPCRIDRRRLWTHRMMLESAVHASSAFATLTYDDQTLPSGSTLVPSHTQKWLKRLRKELSPQQIRYFLVGEYGEQTQRPHYHAAIFGLDPLIGGGDDGCSGIVHNTWGMGHTYVGDLTPQSAQYICGYTTKKLTNKNDLYVQKILNGRHPEFARMSNGGKTKQGGIGAPAMKDVAGPYEEWINYETFRSGTFPAILRHGNKKMPLGRYLRQILRQELGYGRATTDEEKISFANKMRSMFEDETYAAQKEKRPIRNIVQMNAQAILNLENRFKIHSKRGNL